MDSVSVASFGFSRQDEADYISLDFTIIHVVLMQQAVKRMFIQFGAYHNPISYKTGFTRRIDFSWVPSLLENVPTETIIRH
jgi:hypothetical protein